ncbi:hypothetical protein GCM10017635_09260 [Paracoccus kondratievae]|uniref:Uncharacterized protein n=1 Tax=Paracoccus kondratievae TaxID=135740 RepID=A0AAD3NXF4_9RHOB|nr:hypothetical protein pkon1_p63 [Paracoccus phage vB_PkoS_Pkon1]GLK63456.1 hypothetical protein GCM10017635_09260 [Paracoccus kondratievae]
MKRRGFLGALLGVAVAPAAAVRAAQSVETVSAVPVASGAILADRVILGRLPALSVSIDRYAIVTEPIPHGTVTKATFSSVVGGSK